MQPSTNGNGSTEAICRTRRYASSRTCLVQDGGRRGGGEDGGRNKGREEGRKERGEILALLGCQYTEKMKNIWTYRL